MATIRDSDALDLIVKLIESREAQQRRFGESQASQQRQFTESRAASKQDQQDDLEKILFRQSLRGPPEVDDPSTALVSEILALRKRGTTIANEFTKNHPELVALGGKKDLTKSESKELKAVRRQLSALLAPIIDELRATATVSQQLNLGPQAELATTAVTQLSRVDIASPVGSLLERTKEAARGKKGRTAGTEAPGTFSFTGGPGGSSGEFAGNPEDILVALKQFLGRGPGAIERTGPSPGPSSAQARAPVVTPATPSEGPAVGRLFPEGQNTLLDPVIQAAFASILDPDARGAGLGIEGLPGLLPAEESVRPVSTTPVFGAGGGTGSGGGGAEFGIEEIILNILQSLGA